MKKESVILPNNLNAERAVLGTLLNNYQRIDEISDILNKDCFYSDIHQDIYSVIKKFADKGEEASILNVPNEVVQINHNATISMVLDIAKCSISGDLRQYAKAILNLYQLRQLWAIAEQLSSLCTDTTQDATELISRFYQNTEKIQENQPTAIIDLKDGIRRINQLIADNAKGCESSLGTKVGFTKIDNSGGLHKSDLIVVAGESSHGKTSLATSMVVNAIHNGGKIAFYSMEMTDIQIMARTMAIESGVNANHILHSNLTLEEQRKIDITFGNLECIDGNFFIDDRSTSNIDTIISSIKTLKKRKNIDGAVIDYLQILNVNMKNGNKEQAMGDISRRLKNLAKELGIWIIALSQLNRDSTIGAEPTINRLRDSGQIAEAADIVILVYRPEKNGVQKYNAPFESCDTKGTALIDIAKNRNGEIGKFICGFNGNTTHFYELNTIPQQTLKSSIGMPF